MIICKMIYIVKGSKMTKIAFFYPSIIYGGAELLLSRVATILNKMGHDVTVFDICNGQISKLVEKEGIKIVEVEQYTPKKIQFDVVITTANLHSEIFNWITPTEGNKVIFWCVHHYNLHINSERFIKYPRLSSAYNKILKMILFVDWKKIKSKIKLLEPQRGLYSMDSATQNSFETEYNLSVSDSFLPVFTSECDTNEQWISSTSEKLEVFFLSRLSDCKVSPILHVCKSLSALKLSKQISINIIGDGDLSNYLEKELAALSVETKLWGYMDSEKTKSLLSKKADVLFAMGTAALDGASLVIPTVSIDASSATYPSNYKYIWLYQRTGYSLGEMINEDTAVYPYGYTIEELLLQIENDREQIARNCHEYYKINHGQMSTVAKVVLAIENCSLYLKDVKEIDDKPSILKVYNTIKKFRFKTKQRN